MSSQELLPKYIEQDAKQGPVLCSVGILYPSSLTQRDEAQRTRTRPVVVLSSFHVTVGSPEMRKADANAQFAKMDGATNRYLFLMHDAPLAGLPRRLCTSRFVPGGFEAPSERKGRGLLEGGG